MKQEQNSSTRVTRRELVRTGSLLAAAGMAGGGSAPGAPSPDNRLKIGSGIYQSIGVRPLINCEGVITIIGGSLTLPEVKQAMEEASRQFVHLDELAEAVGARLAELTGAEWGIVTAGCAAAMTHATSACITGGDPEKLQRLPDLTGLKNEVVVPRYCRNVYDHAIRMLGVKMVEVENTREFEAALGPRTAMIYMFFGNANQPDGGQAGRELSLENVAQIARQKGGVPVLVDCAAERLSNDYLKRGAALVAYSGGKLLRGPQCAGLLLGRKDLVKAAWLNAAPHHAFGRPMKVGKEEMMGMLAAVEMWVKRNHQAEWKQWQSWVGHIANRVGKTPGVTAEIITPETPVQPCPRVRIQWDSVKLGITGKEAEKLLFEGDPRIRISRATGRRGDSTPSSFMILPVMMSPGDEEIVAERIYNLLSNPPRIEEQPAAAATPTNVAGQWSVQMEYLAGVADHTFFLEQSGHDLRGSHQSQFLSGDLRGTVEGNEIRFSSSQKYEGSYLNYEFSGRIDGDTMEGVVAGMATITAGEYGQARWRAHRHRYMEPGGVNRGAPRKSD